MECAKCGRQSDNIHWSAYANAHLCWKCYTDLPEAQYVAPVKPPVTLAPSKPPKPGAYAKLVADVWAKLERRTGHAPAYLGPRRIGSYCPACQAGTIGWTFLDTTPPEVMGECSRGCTPAQVAQALQ